MEIPIIGVSILLFVLLLVSIFFSSGEIAMISISDGRLSELEEEKNKRAQYILKLREKPAKFLASVEIVMGALQMLAGSFAAAVFAPIAASATLLAGSPIPYEWLNLLYTLAIVVVLIFFFQLFGVVIPKRVAMKNPESAALGGVGVVRAVCVLFAPLIGVINAVANLFLGIGGMKTAMEEDTVSEEEIRMIVDRGTEKGILDDDESEIIRNVFEFGDLTVGKIAVHRTEVTFLHTEQTSEEWEVILNETRHTLYPVCGESADDIVGVLDARDFFCNRGATTEEMLQSIVRPAYFVPETVKADVLLKQMRTTGNYFSVVLDEYGGMLGIVTLHDLIEQLVGEMESEEEAEEAPDVEQLSDFTYRVRGSVLLDDLNEALGINLPTDEYDTFGGYVFGLYGSVPEDGSTIELETERLQILSEQILEHKLMFARVTLVQAEEDEEKGIRLEKSEKAER